MLHIYCYVVKSAVYCIVVNFGLKYIYVLHKGWVYNKRLKNNNSSRYEIYEKNKTGFTGTDYKTNTDVAKELNITQFL
jgi:hypothetical protein